MFARVYKLLKLMHLSLYISSKITCNPDVNRRFENDSSFWPYWTCVHVFFSPLHPGCVSGGGINIESKMEHYSLSHEYYTVSSVEIEAFQCDFDYRLPIQHRSTQPKIA